MPNDRLREALMRNGLTPESAAEELKVNAKTVERWVTQDRIPYPRHRHAIAALVRESEAYLWPDAVSMDRKIEIADSEVIKVYPHRNVIPGDLWGKLIEDTTEQIDILVLAGLFFAEEPGLKKTIQRKTQEGVKIRLLFGDPNADEAGKRAGEERLAEGTVSARISNALALIRPIAELDGVELRLHTTTLYNSIFRFDNQMVVNMHAYGLPGAHAPAMHLRQLPSGDLFETYMTSFEHVWSESASHEL